MIKHGDGRLPERFWKRVRIDGECWTWTGTVGSGGYGQTRWNPWGGRRMVTVHRLAFARLVRLVGTDEHVHHECRNRLCVNPEHLAAVPAREHCGHQHRDKVACPKGHPYDEANTYVRANGHRACRTCQRERMRRGRGVRLGA